MDLADKLKMVLGEGRLLILGAQVVFGASCNWSSKRGFPDVPRDRKAVPELACWRLCWRSAPRSAIHDPSIAYRGEDRRGSAPGRINVR